MRASTLLVAAALAELLALNAENAKLRGSASAWGGVCVVPPSGELTPGDKIAVLNPLPATC
jgi:hypothetical protein